MEGGERQRGSGEPASLGRRSKESIHRGLCDLPGNEEAVTVCHTEVMPWGQGMGCSAGIEVFLLPATAFWALRVLRPTSSFVGVGQPC